MEHEKQEGNEAVLEGKNKVGGPGTVCDVLRLRCLRLPPLSCRAYLPPFVGKEVRCFEKVEAISTTPTERDPSLRGALPELSPRTARKRDPSSEESLQAVYYAASSTPLCRSAHRVAI